VNLDLGHERYSPYYFAYLNNLTKAGAARSDQGYIRMLDLDFDSPVKTFLSTCLVRDFIRHRKIMISIVSSKPACTSNKAPDLRVIVSGVEIGAAWRRTSKDNRSYHSVKLDDPSFTAPIYANLFEGDDATGEGNLCSQTSIDCWAKIPAIAPCDDARVTEGKKGVARSPAA